MKVTQPEALSIPVSFFALLKKKSSKVYSQYYSALPLRWYETETTITVGSDFDFFVLGHETTLVRG